MAPKVQSLEPSGGADSAESATDDDHVRCAVSGSGRATVRAFTETDHGQLEKRAGDGALEQRADQFRVGGRGRRDRPVRTATVQQWVNRKPPDHPTEQAE